MLPLSSTSWLQLFAVATTLPVAWVTPRDASDSAAKLLLFLSALTLLATTNCAVDAAIPWDATTNCSNFPFPETTLSAASLFLQSRIKFKNHYKRNNETQKFKSVSFFKNLFKLINNAYNRKLAPMAIALAADIKPSDHWWFLL